MLGCVCVKCFCEGATKAPRLLRGSLKSIEPHRNVLLRRKTDLSTSSVSGPEIQGQPIPGRMWEKGTQMSSPTGGAGSRSQFPGPFFFLDCRERDPEGKDGSPTLAGPLVQGKSLEIKVKAPCCCPKAPGFRKAARRCNQRRREEVVQVSHKTLSFHGGCGSGCSLMSWTTTPDHILFIKLSLTRGNGRPRLSRLTPFLVQTEPCQRILGIVQNYKI